MSNSRYFDDFEPHPEEEDSTPLLHYQDAADEDPAHIFERLTEGFQAEIRPAPPNSYIISHDSKGYRALDECLDEIGVGKFQHRLLALTAYGHFVEASEYALLGLMLPILAEEFKTKSETELALVGSLTGVGMIIGSTLFAQISNLYGRRLSYQISLFICLLFGFLSSFSNSILTFALLRGGMGIGYGGNLVASTTLLMEFTPSEYRARYMNISGIGYAFGAIYCVALAWIIVPIVGWRWLLRIVALCSIPVLLLLPMLPESPRFYIMRRRPKEAVEVIKAVCKYNSIPLPRKATNECFTLQSEPLTVKNQLYRLSESWKTTLPLALVWFSHSFAGAITSFIPLEITKRDPSKKEAKYEISLVLSCGCLVGSLFLFLTSQRIGRLIQLRVGLFLTAILTCCIGLEPSGIYVYVMGFFLSVITMFPIAMLYLYTGEVHQTETRTIAFAICQFGHRMAPVFSPFVVAQLNDVGSLAITGIVFGSIYFLSFLFSLGLKVETFHRQLVEADDVAQRRGLIFNDIEADSLYILKKG